MGVLGAIDGDIGGEGEVMDNGVYSYEGGASPGVFDIVSIGIGVLSWLVMPMIKGGGGC